MSGGKQTDAMPVTAAAALGNERFAAPTDALPDSLFGTERPAAILEALSSLEKLVHDHDEWLKAWHVVVLSGGHGETAGPVPSPPVLASCLRSQEHRFLRAQPLFQDLGRVLDRLTGLAGDIARTTGRTGRLPADDYRAFMDAVLAFATTVRKLQNETWNRLANIDPLTGLGNRQAMWQRLNIECERHARNHQPCCIAMLDLDFFKPVNDTYGHAVGDMVLRSIASLLAASVRPYDAVFRFGGDEFILCLPNADSRAAWAIVERLRLRVANWAIAIKEDGEVRTTASIGIAPLTSEDGVEAGLEHADAALYAAKRTGRNRVYVWSPDPR